MDPGYSSFTYEAVVHTEPGCVITGNGELTRARDMEDGEFWHLRGNRPGTDCVLIAFRALREETGRWLSVLHPGDEHAPHGRQVAVDGDWLLGWFREIFGAPAVDDRNGAIGPAPIRLLIAPLTKGGGYARPGFVVLTPDGLEDPLRAFRWIVAGPEVATRFERSLET